MQMTELSPFTIQIDGGGIWHIVLFCGTALCALKLTWRYPLWSYVSVWALYLLEFPGNQFGQYHVAFMATAGQTLAEVLLIPMFVLSLTDEWADRLMKSFHWIILYSIICVWTQRDGFMIAPSFNTALIALYLPFADIPLALTSLVTIGTHHGSTALLILAAYLALFMRVWSVFIIPVLLLVAYFHSNQAWFDSADRIEHWRRYMAFWASDWKQIAIGSGPGTFMYLGMMLDEFKPPFFLAMHSDWLQCVFELGLVGLALIGWTIFKCLKRARRNPQVIAGILGCMAMACTYHGLRFFPSAILAALIFRKSLFESHETIPLWNRQTLNSFRKSLSAEVSRRAGIRRSTKTT